MNRPLNREIKQETKIKDLDNNVSETESNECYPSEKESNQSFQELLATCLMKTMMGYQVKLMRKERDITTECFEEPKLTPKENGNNNQENPLDLSSKQKKIQLVERISTQSNLSNAQINSLCPTKDGKEKGTLDSSKLCCSNDEPKKRRLSITDENLWVDPIESKTQKRKYNKKGKALILPGLWELCRAMLHNPDYNPKVIHWENLAEVKITDFKD